MPITLHLCREQHSWPRGSQPPVILMGLLDTVGAQGVPGLWGDRTLGVGGGKHAAKHFPAKCASRFATTSGYSFKNLFVSFEVQHVFQAVATHDRLALFEPCPVRRSIEVADAAGECCAGHYPAANFTTEEVWFPGAHVLTAQHVAD